MAVRASTSQGQTLRQVEGAAGPRREILSALKLRLQSEHFARPPHEAAISLGIAEIDATMPIGLMRGALHEVTPSDHRAMPSALGFLFALVVRVTLDRGGAILWPLTARSELEFGTAYAPGLVAFGLPPDRLITVRCKSYRDALWAMEEGLRIGAIGAVIGLRSPRMNLVESRRLQLAATASQTPIFLLRSHEDLNPSPAVTRWRVSPNAASRTSHGFFEAVRWQITLERARGGRPGTWIVEWDHDARALCLSSALGDRAVSAESPAARRA